MGGNKGEGRERGDYVGVRVGVDESCGAGGGGVWRIGGGGGGGGERVGGYTIETLTKVSKSNNNG